MKRRHLLQLAGTTLATLGLNTLQIQRQGLHYARTLAQPTRRKRALLVGINEYPRESRFTNLKGCVKDVEMQEQLLRHRFGFTDIEILTDANASRDNILTTFEEFLIKPCQDDDVIVFHFSGHGRHILDLDDGVRGLTNEEQREEHLNAAIVPADDDSGQRRDKIASDIMGRTLFLLTSALKTPNVTIVLDSCYAGGGIRGDHLVRSADLNDPVLPEAQRLAGFEFQASQKEVDYQNRWITELNLTDDIVKQRRDIGIAKGIALASARRNQKAVDASFDEFHAGAFTYFLTQYLWHEADSVQRVIANVSINLKEEDFKQKPLGCIAPASCNEPPTHNQNQPVYFVDPQDTDETSAEAVLLSNQAGDRATIWLGGSNPSSIVTYGEGAEFIPAGSAGDDASRIKVISRNGLLAEVALSQPLPEGTRLQESLRVVPRDVTLNIGLDPSLLDRRIRIKFEFDRLDLGERFHLVIPQQEERDGKLEYSYDHDIHYILSRLTSDYCEFLLRPNREPLPEEEQPELPEPGSIVLLSAGIDSVVPGSVQDENADMVIVLQSLKSTFNALYAARFIKLAINADAPEQTLNRAAPRTNPRSQRLKVDVGIQLVYGNGDGGEQVTELSRRDGVMEIPLGAVFRFVITNQEAEQLYLSILEVDQGGDVTPLFPNQFTAAADRTIIQSRVPNVIPDPDGPAEFFIENRIRAEFLFIVSRRSPRQALLALKNDQRSSNVPVVDALLADISGVELNRSTAQRLKMSTADFAAFSLPFRVV